MEKIEELRKNLYIAMGKGNQKEILILSMRLDKLIVRFMKEENQRKMRIKF